MTPSYPHAPGFKARDTETSELAAISVAPKAKELSELVERVFHQSTRGMTHDQCAECIWSSGGGLLNTAAFERFKRNVRSRASELKAEGKLEALPQRGKNASGHSAVVWRHVVHAATKPEVRVQQQLL